MIFYPCFPHSKDGGAIDGLAIAQKPGFLEKPGFLIQMDIGLTQNTDGRAIRDVQISLWVSPVEI